MGVGGSQERGRGGRKEAGKGRETEEWGEGRTLQETGRQLKPGGQGKTRWVGSEKRKGGEGRGSEGCQGKGRKRAAPLPFGCFSSTALEWNLAGPF